MIFLPLFYKSIVISFTLSWKIMFIWMVIIFLASINGFLGVFWAYGEILGARYVIIFQGKLKKM